MAANKRMGIPFWVCLLAVLIASGITVIKPALAEEMHNSSSPSVMVVAEYDSDLDVSENDGFRITYTNDETGESDSVQFMASDIVGYDTYELPEGNYTVTDIEYAGDNELITEEGYGTVSFFYSDSEGGSILRISVGDTQVKKLISTDYYAVVKDEQHQEDGTWKSGEELSEMGVIEERYPVEEEDSSVTDDSSNESEDSTYHNDDSGENTDGASREDAEIVYFEEEGTNSEAMSVVRSLVYLGVVLVVGVLILWLIGKRKNK